MVVAMTKHEGQMTKEAINVRDAAKHSAESLPSIVRASSLFRHSFKLMLVLVLAIGVSCSGKRIAKANVDEVLDGMSKKQVESILGPPTTIDNQDLNGLKKTTYVYRQGNDTVTLVFKDDKLESKDSTLSD
jgi:SmpA / OmlA family